MRNWHMAIHGLLAVLLIIAVISGARTTARLQMEINHLKMRLLCIESNVKWLAKGEKTISVYDTPGTDEILGVFANRQDIEQAYFEMTDVSAAGVKALSTMPSLKSVTFISTMQIKDDALEQLAACPKLESLRLEAAQVTAAGIAAFERVPTLRTLKIDFGVAPPPASALVEQLSKLTQLTELELGSWASDKELADLQSALPNCEVRMLHRSQTP
jgi:hypothetical protein